MSNSEWNDPEANVLPDTVDRLEANGEINSNGKRKKVVVVGLGMVGVSFVYEIGMSFWGYKLNDVQQRKVTQARYQAKRIRLDCHWRRATSCVQPSRPHLFLPAPTGREPILESAGMGMYRPLDPSCFGHG